MSNSSLTEITAAILTLMLRSPCHENYNGSNDSKFSSSASCNYIPRYKIVINLYLYTILNSGLWD